MAKNQSSQVPVKWTPGKGGLISDIIAEDMQNSGLFVTGADTGGLNIRAVGKGLGTSPAYEPIYGNTLVYAPEEVVVQNKKFRLDIDLSIATAGACQYILTLTSVTGNQFVYADNTITISDIATALTDIETNFNADFAAYTPTVTTTQTGTYTGYLEIEFTAAPYFNYVLSESVLSNTTELTVVVTQESVDPSMLGEWNLIGSDDEIGDCFQFWTTRRSLPVEVAIFNVTNNAGVINIETVTAHGLVAGQSVRVSGIIGVPEANGEWVIDNLTSTTFDLVLSSFAGPTYIGGTGKVTSYIYGLGEIGVAVESNEGVISYTRLLRSNEFNFMTLHQIDCRTKRKQDSKIATYFTDNYNQYRVFYYKGDYVSDGAVSGINAQYYYGLISIDLQLFISNEGFGISFFNQIQIGGSVKSGNWRYAVAFLTTELVRSEWSQLTDTVSVFSSNISGSAYGILGDDEDTPTPKQNTLAIANAIPGLYDFCEIAAINYIGSSMTGYVIGRYVLDGSAIQYINHTGNENNETNLDLGELNALIPGIRSGQNLELLNGRLIISNLRPQQTLDFTEWVETFQYSIEREALNPIGEWQFNYTSLDVGEYQLPNNIYSKKSHMIYETYRYGFRFRLKGSGAITDVFYPGYDIKIDLPAPALWPSERVPGTFTSFDLTDGVAGTPSEVYTFYINWLNINLSFLIDGIPVYELISEIIPCRAEVIPEVLSSGASVLGVSAGNAAEAGLFLFYGLVYTTPLIGPFPWFAGYSGGYPVWTPVPNPTYPAQTAFAEVAERDTVFFFSPDISFNQKGIAYRDGDKIISFGNDFRHGVNNFASGTSLFEGDYAEFSGYSGITSNPTANNMLASLLVPGNVPSIDVGGSICSLRYVLRGDVFPNPVQEVPFIVDQCQICKLTSNLNNSGANSDYGFYRSIYYRQLDNKYGDPNTTIYTEFGEPYNINSLRGFIDSNEIKSYGDVFTQKTYLKFRNPENTSVSGFVTPINGGGLGIGYYSQNTANLQLRRKPTAAYPATSMIPAYNQEAWLTLGISYPNSPYIVNRDAQFFYNKGYTPRNKVTSALGYDSTKIYQVDWGNAMMWSNSEVDGSNTDYNRIFPPLNIKFLDYTFGSITDARDINGQLVTIQPSRVMRQYFNTTEMISSEIGSEIILGDGGVMRREGQVLTKFGSQNKPSVLVGKSDKGFDVLYFIDVINKTVCRYGYNGNDAIDEINGMKSFFANYLQWVTGKNTPAHDEGIHGVINQRYREVIWTLRGRKAVQEWVRDEVIEVPILDWEIVYGSEQVVNGNFNGNINGWTPLDAAFAPAATWTWGINVLPGQFIPSTLHDTFLDGYQAQTIPLTFTPFSFYEVNMRCVDITTSDVSIYFQSGGPLAKTINAAGNYMFTHQAIGGDDNIYIYQDSFGYSVFTGISIREIISVNNWTGGSTWAFSSLGATANGIGTDFLENNVTPYIVSGLDYVLTYEIIYGTAGTVTAYVSEVADVPRNTSGIFTFNASPLFLGVISFLPSATFDGTVVKKWRLFSDNPKNYQIGDVVQVAGTNFEETPDIYVALAGNFNSPPTPVNTDWEQILHTDPRYYTEYSIIFAEMKDAFQSFFTIKPKIYAKLRNRYLVPRPVSNTGFVYVSDSGSPTTWFTDPNGSQTSNAYLDAVINAPEGRKRFLDVRVDAEIAPYRMEVETETQVSFTPGTDFVTRPTGEHDAYVKNDSTLTGLSDGDTSSMYGQWMRYRFIILATTYNKFNGFIAKVRVLSRKFFS